MVDYGHEIKEKEYIGFHEGNKSYSIEKVNCSGFQVCKSCYYD